MNCKNGIFTFFQLELILPRNNKCPIERFFYQINLIDLIFLVYFFVFDEKKGIAKSQLLKYVARLCPRSVFTTGIGSTNAGLTASAIKVAENILALIAVEKNRSKGILFYFFYRYSILRI